MSQSRKPHGGRGRGLSPEDQALWDQVSRSVERVALKPRHHPAFEADEAITSEELRQLMASLPDPPRAKRQVDQPVAAKPTAPVRPPPRPASADFERRKARRIASGRIEIEGRLDLHGLTQAEAHRALRSFLRASHDRDRRLVLVITGKGASGYDTEQHLGERGVLKRNVPHWLAEPGLREIVVGFTDAGPRHGGNGALYVQLRARTHGRA